MPFECEVETDPATLAALEELLRQRWMLEQLQAQAEQDAFARECKQLKAVDGIGAVKRAVHPAAFFDWGLKLGSFDCWQDRGFLKYFDRIAPETRVDSLGTKTQVGYGRGARAGTAPKIVKVTRRADALPRNVRESKAYAL
jgi:hypothetical protein